MVTLWQLSWFAWAAVLLCAQAWATAGNACVALRGEAADRLEQGGHATPCPDDAAPSSDDQALLQHRGIIRTAAKLSLSTEALVESPVSGPGPPGVGLTAYQARRPPLLPMISCGVLVLVLGCTCLGFVRGFAVKALSDLVPADALAGVLQWHPAWLVVLLASLVDTLLVGGIWGVWCSSGAQEHWHRDFANPLGWVAAAGAALIFGFSEVPIKVPGSQEVGPTLFNAYGFIASGVVHCALAVMLLRGGGVWQLQWTGFVAACNLATVQAFARNAIWLLGIAVAPPLWCAVGMATAFAWGTMVFGDCPASVALSLVGLLLLMAGVGLVSWAGFLSQANDEDLLTADRRLFQGRPPNSSDAASGHTGETPAGGGSWQPGSLLTGVLYGLGAGVCDGSLVAFYQHVENRGLGDEAADVPLAAVMGSYFGSFGLSIFLIGVASVSFVHIVDLVMGSGEGAAAPAATKMVGMVSGMVSGSMWAAANSCSVLASHFLGMAVSFPITQTAVVFSGLAGMLIFGELQGCCSRSVFSVALAAMMAGTTVLSVFGQPSPHAE